MPRRHRQVPADPRVAAHGARHQRAQKRHGNRPQDVDGQTPHPLHWRDRPGGHQVVQPQAERRPRLFHVGAHPVGARRQVSAVRRPLQAHGSALRLPPDDRVLERPRRRPLGRTQRAARLVPGAMPRRDEGLQGAHGAGRSQACAMQARHPRNLGEEFGGAAERDLAQRDDHARGARPRRRQRPHLPVLPPPGRGRSHGLANRRPVEETHG
mmetsp:Transcript_22472/g.45203  ORF Transcript_22472/g.45203 Transcript_22472/m.45203 type:complete len:211 (-) Transcript_22472:571-1203(-)